MVEQGAIGDRYDAARGIDLEAAAGVVGQAVGDRINGVRIHSERGDTDGGPVRGAF